MRRLTLIVRGRVQGVFYRASTQERAVGLGLTGWVRNLRDGGVEIVAEGSAASLASLEAWCEEGPPSARVDSMEAVRSDAVGEFRGFEIRSTV